MTLQYRTPILSHTSLRGFEEVNAPSIQGGNQRQYVILSKNYATGTYEEYAFTDTVSEAWTARRTLADLNKDRKFFLRSRVVFVVGPSSPEATEDRDLWQDAWKTGNDHLIPADQQSAYKVWAAKKTQNVYARFGGGAR